MTCIAVTNTFEKEKLRKADLIVDSLKSVDLEILDAL